VFWRDVRARTAALTWAALELCVLGGGNLPVGGSTWPGRLLPWHWLQGLPGLAQVLPWRFSILADGAAAAVLAFAVDRALAAMPRDGGWRRWPGAAFVCAALLAAAPLVPLPYHAAVLRPVPAGWQATFTRLRLPSDAPVLALPFPSAFKPDVMRWQADTGQPGALVGGYFLEPGPTGEEQFYFSTHDEQTEVAGYLNAVWQGHQSRGPSATEIRAVLSSWHAAAIVVVTSPHSPIARLLTQFLGRPAYHIGRVLSWSLRR
jgi:hypothetical protein